MTADVISVIQGPATVITVVSASSTPVLTVAGMQGPQGPVGAPGTVPITQQSGSAYTLVLGDAGSDVETTNVGTVNVIVPPHSAVAFPVGTLLSVRQIGAGSPIIINGTGVTLRAPNGTKAAAQYSTISLVQRAIDEWVISGDTIPAVAIPLSPTIGSAVALPNSVVVNFTPSAAGPAATSFTVTATPGGAQITDVASPIAFPGLTASTAYTFTIHASNAGGNSAESASVGATPTPPTAATILTTGMVAWHKADQISGFSDAAPVSYWADNSGAGNTLVQQAAANQPIMRSTSGVVTLPNSKPVLDFDGVHSTMKSALGISTQPMTVFIVTAYTGVAGSTRVPVNAGGLTGPYLQSSGAWSIFGGTTLTGIGSVITGWNALAGQFNGATSFVAENGSHLRDGNAGTTAPNNNILTVGADAGSISSLWLGQIAEVIVYSGVLATADINTIKAYFSTKYGTP